MQKIKVVRIERAIVGAGTPAEHEQIREHRLFRGSKKAWDLWKPLHEVKATDVVTGL